MRNLFRIAHGKAKREQAAWDGPCHATGCDWPVVGIVETLTGPVGVCRSHARAARDFKYELSDVPNRCGVRKPGDAT